MSDFPEVRYDPAPEPDPGRARGLSRHESAASLREFWGVLVRRRRLVLGIVGGLLVACLLYCLIAPNQYEASAKVALRTSPASPLSLDSAEPMMAASILSAPLEQETLANVLRSDRLAWKVITELKLYQAPGFAGGLLGSFSSRFPGFRVEAPGAAAQEYLLERFQRRLHVQTLPRTLVLQIRFRSKDAALSAAVVNALIRAYQEEENESRVEATVQASAWLREKLDELKARVDQDRQRLAVFEREHGVLSTPETLQNGQPGESQHNPVLLEIDELGRDLVAVTADRILREAKYRAATQGDPELVLASDAQLQGASGGLATTLLEQIHSRRSELELEAAQLSAEHGPNFPRVVEIRHQLEDLERQKQAEDAKLVGGFKAAWQTAVNREKAVEASLQSLTAKGMGVNEAATEYAVMRQEANSSHALYVKVLERAEEAGMAAGIRGSNISVVDFARVPGKPVAPDLPLYLAITFFAGLWIAVAAVLMVESMGQSTRRAAAVLLAVLLATGLGRAQAPTPSTSGLPSGVAHLPPSQDTWPLPNAKEAPAIWTHPEAANQPGVTAGGVPLAAAPMPAPMGPGDFLDISEYHTPEFHTVARVSPAGTVVLPMIGEIRVGGLDEQSAAHAIEAELVSKGMLLHPQVAVLVSSYAGQDVSVLGEVTRPGVYSYTLHHRLLDLISAASGLAPSAGRLVNVFHRNDPKTPHPVVLDPSGTDTGDDHNPELSPGDTVQVSRAGLVYVVGDVLRPGGFPVDPADGLTVVQALTLAWGPSQNALSSKAILIREQKGGRTLTELNLKRMLHGQEPDQLVHDRDILYVPDSMARVLWNKVLESAIQSAVGVSIYAGLVYSQWHVPKTSSTSASTSTTSTTGTTTGSNSGTTTGSSTSTTTTTTTSGP